MREGRRHTLLYDAPLGPGTAVHNLRVLNNDLKDVRTVVFSHGHADHHTELDGIARSLGQRGLPLVLHPDAWRDRRVVFPTVTTCTCHRPVGRTWTGRGWQVVEERGPSLLFDGAFLVTGQVNRVTDFEKGFPPQQARSPDGSWEPDPWLWDDQAWWYM